MLLSEADRQKLRTTFDEDAELYDKARPHYPQQLFDDLVHLASLKPGARLLEIGCGTGRATVPLARIGFGILGVELGENLAAIARRNSRRFRRSTLKSRRSNRGTRAARRLTWHSARRCGTGWIPTSDTARPPIS